MGEGRADPVSLLLRYVVDDRQRALFPRGARVLEIGAAAGALPPSPGAGLFDAAWAGPGALDGIEPWRLAGWLPGVLRPGAPLLLCVRSPLPLPGLLERVLTGAGEWRGRRASRVAGRPAPPTLREVREALGRGFVWRGSFALGLLLPGPGRAAWAAEWPQLFGLLAAAEGLLRRWPVLRGLGTWVALEGVRV